MADYVAPLGTRTNPRKPITSEWAKAADDRPIAIAEGAAGAPRVQGKALGGISIGAIVVTGTGGQGYNDLAGMSLLRADVVGLSLANRILRARYSSNNGSTYGSWLNIVACPDTTGSFAGHVRINLQSGAFHFSSALSASSGGTDVLFSASGTHTVPSGCNAFQLSWDVASNTMNADFFCLGGIA